jgi:hypothetical protein
MSRRFKTLTKAHVAKLENLVSARDKAMDEIYFGRGGNMSFWDCYDRANNKLQRWYRTAAESVIIFERQMIAEGRGYMDKTGHFQPHAGR